MSISSDQLQDGSRPNAHVQSAGPAILQLRPEQAFGNVITRTNNLISGHREWLANLPHNKLQTTQVSSTRPASSLVTTPPSIEKRIASPDPHPEPQVFGQCDPLVASSASSAGSSSALVQFSVSLASASATAAASIASLQAALSAASASLSSVRSSATLALALASQSISVATQAASDQSRSALAASSSASQAIAGAQSTASASVLSANNALTSVQSSASSAVASAIAVASDARVSATNVIQQAESSISAVAAQATEAIAASRISAMNTTKFVLVVTFSILGSSLLTILAFYLIIRYRRSRRIKRLSNLKASIRQNRPQSDESSGPSLSDFPFPVNRTQWSRVQSEERPSRNRSLARSKERSRNSPSYWPRNNGNVNAADKERQTWMREADTVPEGRQVALPTPTARRTWTVGPAPRPRDRLSAFPPTGNQRSPARQTWSPEKEDLSRSQSATLVTTPAFPSARTMLLSREGQRTGGEMSERPNMVRKNTLTYDPEHPERPPKFTSWLEETFRSISPFPTIGTVQSQRPELNRPTFGRQSTWVEGSGPENGRGQRINSDISDIGTAI